MPDSNILYAANVAALLMDPDQTGKPTNEKIRQKFAVAEGKYILGGGITEADENKSCASNDSYYCNSFQIWQTKMENLGNNFAMF